MSRIGKGPPTTNEPAFTEFYGSAGTNAHELRAQKPFARN